MSSKYLVSTAYSDGLVYLMGDRSSFDEAKELALYFSRQLRGDAFYVTTEGDPSVLFSCVVPK